MQSVEDRGKLASFGHFRLPPPTVGFGADRSRRLSWRHGDEPVFRRFPPTLASFRNVRSAA
jgi:hypothetical protein